MWAKNAPHRGVRGAFDGMLRLLQESAVAPVGLVNVGLGADLIGSVHGQKGHAAVDDLHAVLGHDVGDGAAAAHVHLA